MTNVLEDPRELQFGEFRFWNHKAFVQATTNVMQLLTIPHKESAAGANPREFQGMKSATNKKVLESMLKHFDIMFTAHHQGVTVTTVGGDVLEGGRLTFEDACLVNGLQTVTLARILVMVKAYQQLNERAEVHKKINKSSDQKWHEAIDEVFSKDAAEQLHAISIDHVNSVLTWLHQPEHSVYLKTFNGMTLEQVLSLPLTVKVVLLDKLIPDDVEDHDEAVRGLGMGIAEANNETQKVKADDLFGTKHRELLQHTIFSLVRDPFVVEYVRLEADRRAAKSKIIHVLDLLRAILPTTIIMEEGEETPESFVANYAAHRERVYNLFQRFLDILGDESHPKHIQVKKAFSILRSLIPCLLEIRNEVETQWEEIRSKLSLKVVSEWGHDLRKTTLASKIFFDSQGNERKTEDDINRAVREHLGFSFANAFPVFVFATRPSIVLDGDLNASLTLSQEQISAMVDAIYSRMVELRLTKTYSSTSNLFRDPALYRGAAQAFRQFLKFQKLDPHDYTEDVRQIV